MKFLVPEEEIQVGFLMMHRKNNMSDLVCTTCLHFIIITQPAHVWDHHQPNREMPLEWCLASGLIVAGFYMNMLTG